MKWIVERFRYLPMVAILGMLISALAATYLGVIKTFHLVELLWINSKEAEPILYTLFEALDSFLIATALIVIATALYELFIGVLDVPDWMLVIDLTELKAKFTFVIIPVMAVKFVQKILKFENSIDVLYYGIAISLVAIALTFFNFISIKEKEAKDIEKQHDDGSETRAADLKKNKE